MGKQRVYAVEAERYAEPLRGNHPEIADATIGYVFREGTMKSGGEEILGRVTTIPDKYQTLMRKLSPNNEAFDFVIEIGSETWDQYGDKKRKAYLDLLLCQCEGEMQDDGTMKYTTGKPTIQTDPSVIKRHGAYDVASKQLLNRLGIDEGDIVEDDDPSDGLEI